MRCAACGHELPGDARFCPGCGLPTADPDRLPEIPRHLADKIRASRSALVGERKQVSVLFADVKGSMDIQEDMDPEAWRDVVEGFFKILCQGVHRFEGTVTRFTGDGIMALFGAPIAHEDHARRACYASLHLLEKLGEYADKLRRTRGLNFSVRIGVNAGEVVVGSIGENLEMDYTALGHTVGLAQRVESLAAPDKAYVTDAVASLAEGFFELRDLGAFQIKGVTEPVQLHELVGTGPLRTRFDLSKARGFSKFVGRSDEMAVLDSALDSVLEGGGEIVGVVGEPGVGKSRLCYEFALKCRLRDIAVRQASALAHATNVPFLLVLELLRDVFGITDADSDLEARRKVAGTLVLLDPDLMDALPLLFDFLGIPDPERPVPSMDPEVRQRHLLELVGRIIQARGRKEPRVVIFEDLHWLDPASERFVAHVAEVLPGSRTLLLLNFRPEYTADWTTKPYYRQISLLPLGRDAIEELLRDLLGSDASVQELGGLIDQRTAGNPFFIEEVVNTLAESGVLEGERGAYVATRSVDEITIPATVQSTLAARIDRLEDRDKSILQAASVIGVEFAQPVLERVAGAGADDVVSSLQTLLESDFIYESSLYPHPEYTFKHPLTQEIAYGSQLSERRRHVHALVARALGDLDPERLDEHAALISAHWEAAGDYLAAAGWSRRAAQWVGIRNRVEAVGHWRRVLGLLERAPETSNGLQLGLVARAGLLNAGFLTGLVTEDEADGLYRDGMRMSQITQDLRALATLVSGYGGAKGASGKPREGLEFRTRAVEIADQTDDLGLRASLRVGLMLALGGAGRQRESLAVGEEVRALVGSDMEMGRSVTGSRPALRVMVTRTGSLTMLGRLSEAVVQLDELEARARELGEREDLALAFLFRANIAYRIGDLDIALSRGLQALEQTERNATPFFRIFGRSILTLIYMDLGRWGEARAMAEGALELIESYRVGRGDEATLRGHLAYITLRLGNPVAATTMARQAVEMAVERGVVSAEHGSRRTLGRIMLEVGGAEAVHESERELRRALDIIRETGQKVFEPAALLDLAEVASARGDASARADHLREAHLLCVEMGMRPRADAIEAHLRAL